MIGKMRDLVTLWRNRTLAPAQLEALQLRKLRAVVRAARRDVPFYRELYASAGVDPDQLRTMDDLQRIPIVTKPMMRAAGLETVVSERLAPPCRVTLHTSGTSGVPLAIPLAPADARIRSLVDFAACLRWASVRGYAGDGGPRVSASACVARAPGAIPDHRDLQSGTLDEQVGKLRQEKPDILWCYPSELNAMLHHANHPLHAVKPRFLIVSGRRPR